MCVCGATMSSVGLREKTLKTILGPVKYKRSLFVCPACGKSRFPGDEALGVQGTGFSPRLQRFMARAGSRTSFGEAEEDLRVYTDVYVDRKDIERVSEGVGKQIEQWMSPQREIAIRHAGQESLDGMTEDSITVLYISFDGTGIPMRAEELVEREGKHPDGSAKTREVKLGCVFTQSITDERGRAVRDPASTTYTGAIETSEEFGVRIYAEALMRGLDRAKKIVVLTDGARYNKSIIEMHFSSAIHIIDLYHAREHLYEVSKILFEAETQKQPYEHQWLKLLDEGQIEALADQIERHLPHHGDRRKKLLKEINYFMDNATHMRYASFKKQGLFVGSGVIEAGCRTIIAHRLKNSGMFWSLEGANAIIASRCCQFSGRFETFWEQNAA